MTRRIAYYQGAPDGLKALAVRADASDADVVKAAVAKTVQSFGRLDILVNNAGSMIVKSVNDLSLEDVDRIVTVNVKGLFVATQEAVRPMGEGGRIINIGSLNSDHSELDNRSVIAVDGGRSIA